MLTNEDIQNLIKAQEEAFVTKLDLENFRDEYKKDFDLLQKSVNAYAVKADKFFSGIGYAGPQS